MKFKVIMFFIALQPLSWTFLFLLPPKLMFNLYRIAQLLWLPVNLGKSLGGGIIAPSLCLSCIKPLTVFYLFISCICCP